MSDNDGRSVVEPTREIASTNSVEHIVSVLKAGLATVPFAGGIASLISDYIPSAKQRRVEAFAQKIAAAPSYWRKSCYITGINLEDFTHTFIYSFPIASLNALKYRSVDLMHAMGIIVPEMSQTGKKLRVSLQSLSSTIPSFGVIY